MGPGATGAANPDPQRRRSTNGQSRLAAEPGDASKESIETKEADAYRRVQKGFVNPRRLRDARLRVSFLTLSLMLGPLMLVAWFNLHQPIALLTSTLIVPTTVVLHVLACDPLPPCVGKVMEWVRGLARFRPVRVRA
jgi:hypothetical protein